MTELINRNDDLDKALLQSLPTGIGIYDVTGRMIEMKYLNDGYYQMIDADVSERSQFSGARTMMAIHPDDRNGLVDEAVASIEEKRMFQYRFRVLSGGGRYIWIGIRANHEPISSDTERFYAVYYNVNNYLDEQQQLKTAKRDIEKIISNIPGGISVFSDRGGHIHLDYTNDGFFELHHGSREYWASRNGDPSLWLIEEDRHIFTDEFRKVNTGEKIQGSATYRVVGEDGEIHWVNNQFRKAYVQDGIQYYYAVFVCLDEQKEAEKAKNEARRMYEAAVEDAKLVVWEYDIINRRIIMAENEFTQYDYRKFGLPKITENVPTALVPYIDDDYVDVFLDMYRKVDEGAPSASCEVWYKLMPGTEPRCERITYTTVFDEEGRPVKAFGLGQNITAQKNEQMEYYRLREQIADSLMDVAGSFQVNLSKNIFISGYSPDERLVRSLERETANEHFTAAVDMIINEEIREELRPQFNCGRLIEMYASGKKRLECEYPVLSENGGIVWVHLTLFMMQNPNSGDIEGITYAKNITRQRKDEEILTEMARAGCDYIGLIDLNSETFEIHNGMWDCRNLRGGSNLKYDDAVALLTEERLSEEDRIRLRKFAVLENLKSLLDEEGAAIIVFNMKDGDGEVQSKQIKSSWLNGGKSEILVIQTDITDSYKLEQAHLQEVRRALEQAEQANRAKSEFVSRISHDIRTPISAITSMTAFAREDVEDKARLNEDLDKIEASSAFLLSLINDILDISKIDSGKIELHPEPYAFEEFSKKLTSMFGPLCEKKGISFVIEANEAAGNCIMVDRIRFDQVILNLLSNAVKFTPAGGTITYISKSRPISDTMLECQYTIRDTGIGMSEEFQQVMFDSFSQEHSQYRKNNGVSGSGLGLAIVYRIVRLMDGYISVKSRLGEGTEITVSIKLPRLKSCQIEEMLNESSVPSGEEKNGTCGKILLAEDNEINTEIAVRILEQMGYTVVHGSDGAEAAEIFERSEPGEFSAVLMDIQMPVMDGYEATKRIRSLDRKDAGTVPVIAMTADAFSEARKNSIEAGMTDYVVKPIDVELLKAVLKKWTGGGAACQ